MVETHEDYWPPDPKLVFRSGMWAAYNDVLNYINTLEDKVVSKKTIYAAVQEMRPRDPTTKEDFDRIWEV